MRIRDFMYIGRWLYNAFRQLIRKIVGIMKLNRDVMLILLAIVSSSMVIVVLTLTENLMNANWGLPLWYIILAICAYIIFLGALIFAIKTVTKNVQKIDDEEEKRRLYQKAKLDAIADKLNIYQDDIQRYLDKEAITMPKSEPQPPLTKKRFEKLLMKSAQPVSDWESEKARSETSESHPSDGCNGKRKNQDKTGDKED